MSYILDPNEAPNGYEAVNADTCSCKGCVFARDRQGGWECAMPSSLKIDGFANCTVTIRKDGCNVIFKKKSINQVVDEAYENWKISQKKIMINELLLLADRARLVNLLCVAREFDNLREQIKQNLLQNS